MHFILNGYVVRIHCAGLKAKREGVSHSIHYALCILKAKVFLVQKLIERLRR